MTNKEVIEILRSIRVYDVYPKSASEETKQAIDLAIKALEQSEERPQGEWTLVGEGLPEIDKEVIVTDIETTDTYCSWYHGNGYWECDNGVFKNRIIAWQPLPEPYQKGGAK